jgi:hypothetical protein
MHGLIKDEVETRAVLEDRIMTAHCVLTRKDAIRRLYNHAFYKGILIGLFIAFLFHLVYPNGMPEIESYGQP